MGLWHRKQSTAPASANPAKVGGPDWNDEHVVDPGSFTDVEIAEANKDGDVTVPSMRTLGTGALQAAAGNHNHAGTYATPADVAAAVAALAGAAPAVLDTLVELATALGNDPNFATTIATALAGKQPLNANLTTLAAVMPGATGTALLGAATAAAARGTLALANVAATGAASDVSGLATVAVSGAYADLSGKPSLGTAALVDTGTGPANDAERVICEGSWVVLARSADP